MSGIKRFFITLLVLTGLVLSIKLMFIYLAVNFNPNAAPSFCNINEFINCDGVAQTDSARFLGIPMALWGIFLYLFLLFLTFVDKIQKLPLLGFLKIFKNHSAYIASIGVLTFFTSAALASISIFKLNMVCYLCFITYFINITIGFIARNPEKGFVGDIITSFKDFFDAIKNIGYAIAFLCCCVLFGVFVFAINKYEIFKPTVISPQAMINSYRATGNILGSEEATVIVNLYTDFYCSHCRIQNAMMHKAAKEMSNILVIHHDFPLDRDCNPVIKGRLNPNSCISAKYSMAAGEQDKLWDMIDLLFEKQPESEAAILKLAKSIKGLDVEKLQADAYSEDIAKKLQYSIQSANEQNISATPTMIINGQVYTGSMLYEDLTNILLDNGAKLKVFSLEK